MSVKHIEYLKVKESKLLVVEVRPVKCLLDTPSGPTYTDKWMEHSHWKELYDVLMNIVDEYEEQKATQKFKCNLPMCKTGETIQMGYMFRSLPSCWCSLYFLTPRSSCTWTEKDDGDSGKLQDKGGCFKDLVACGEMLVISVILRDPAERSTESVPHLNSSTSHQQACLNKKLIKALDSRMEYTNSVSCYFNASNASDKDDSSKSVSSSSKGKKKCSPVRVKSFKSNRCKEHKKENYSSTVDHDLDSSHCDAHANSSTHLDLTLGNPNPQGERSEEEDNDFGYDAAQLTYKDKAKEIQRSKKSLKSFKTSKHFTQLSEECYSDLFVSETESRHFYLFGMKSDKVKKKVNVNENLKRNSETLQAEDDSKIMEEFREIPSKKLSALSYEMNGNKDSCIEVKEEADSDSESHHYEWRTSDSSFSNNFSQNPCVAQRCDAELKYVKLEAQNVNCLGPSQACGSVEQNSPQNIFHNANLSERVQEENVEGNARDSAGYISPETVSHNSFVTILSSDSDKTVLVRMTGDNDKVSWLSEDVDENEMKIEVVEDEIPHRTKREYAQQRDITKRKKKKIRGHSSSSEYSTADMKYSSGAKNKSFFYDSATKAVETGDITHVFEDLFSSVEKEDYIPEKVELEAQPTEKSVTSLYQEEYEYYVKDVLNTKTKVQQGYLSSERLMPQVNNHDKSSHVKIQNYSEGGYPTSYQHSANIQSNELNKRSSQATNCDVHSSCPKMPEEIYPSKKALKSSKCFQQITQLTLEQCENVMTSDTECQSSQLEMKHGNEKKKVTAHRNLTKNLETSPELQYTPINIKYLSGTKESLFSAKDSVIGNEAVHHTRVFENLSSDVEKKKHKSEGKQNQVQLLEASDLSLCKEDILEFVCGSVEENVPQRIQGKTKGLQECLSPERLLLQENSNLQSSDMSVDSFSISECPHTLQSCPEVHSSALNEESSQQSTTDATEEDSLCTSYQKGVKKKKSVVESLRSIKFFKHHRNISKDAGRLHSENKSCEEKKESYKAEEIKKRKEKLDKSKVNKYAYEMKECMEVPSGIHSSTSNEKNSEAEESNSDFTRGRVGYPFLEGYYFDHLSPDHGIIVSSSSPEVSDADYDLQLEDHGYDPQSFSPYPAYALSQQKNAHSVPLDASLYAEEIVGTENDIKSNISSSHNCNQTMQEKRSRKGDTAAKYVDECDSRMDDRVSSGRADEYVPKKVIPQGVKILKRHLPDPDYIPTDKFQLSQLKNELFFAENSTTLVKEADHSTQDLLKENSAESPQKYISPKSHKSSSTSEECISPNSEQSESEKMMHLRRSKRIRTKASINFSELWNTSCDTCDEDSSEWSSREKLISSEIEKSKKNSHKYAKKKIVDSGVLKQRKILTYIKRGSSSKKQLRSPDKVNSALTDENENQEDSGKLVKKKGIMKSPHKATAKEISSKQSSSKHSKPSCSKHSRISSSKHELCNKAQVSKNNASLNDYNEIWNFTLPDEQMNKEGKNNSSTSKERGKKSTSKISKKASENSSEEKRRKKKTIKSSLKSDAENYAPNIIDDEFYWRIQAETEKLCALTNDLDDTLGSRTSDDSNPGKSSKSRGEEKQPQEKRNSREEECFILNEVPESTHSLASLRTSYKQLHNMTKSDLEQRLDENIPYLEQVIRGDVPNERHELYKQSSNELRLQQDYLIYGPFTSDQSLHVLDLLKKKLSHMEELIGDAYDLLTYRCRVLVPTFFTKIVMDNENVSMKEAYRLMAKFTLNKDIADDIQSIESRRF